jgi:hypothetical protein
VRPHSRAEAPHVKTCEHSLAPPMTSAAQQAVDRQPHLVVAVTSSLSPVVKYYGLARRHLLARRLLMRPLLNRSTLGALKLCDRKTFATSGSMAMQ